MKINYDKLWDIINERGIGRTELVYCIIDI